jgi:hypothetical protein
VEGSREGGFANGGLCEQMHDELTSYICGVDVMSGVVHTALCYSSWRNDFQDEE